MLEKDILEKISKLLLSIDSKTIEHYHSNITTLTSFVNNKLEKQNNLEKLIGFNSFDLVKANHSNHAQFMYSVFLSKDAKATYETYIWAYDTYHNKGFSFEYFEKELKYWIDSFTSLDNSLESIIKLYEYLISLHEYFIKKVENKEVKVPEGIIKYIYEEYLEALLKADLNLAIDISKKYIKEDKDIKVFWEQVILPSLYTIGEKWQDGSISVGEEHTATSICQKVMAEHYSKILSYIDKDIKIIVTTGPFELHELGARMLSDTLELNGFDIFFLGSNTNIENIIDTILEENIKFLIFSSTIVSNLPKLDKLILKLKEECQEDMPKVIVGGQALSRSEIGKSIVHADYFINSLDDLLDILQRD